MSCRNLDSFGLLLGLGDVLDHVFNEGFRDLVDEDDFLPRLPEATEPLVLDRGIHDHVENAQRF